MSLDQQINDFFDTNKPCGFEGCDELRGSFNAELEELKAKRGCFECRRNQVVRRYIDKIMPIIKNGIK